MPGVKGAGGPIPKRSEQTRHRGQKAAGDPVKAPAGTTVGAVEADPSWHPVMRRWFESLAESGQSAFYEASDWATAAVVAETMSRDLLDGEPVKAASMAAFLKGCTALLATDGDRRRAALELQRGPVVDEEAGHVEHLTDARLRLAGAG